MRVALVAEQRGLCAYCNRRIDDGAKTTIEHWYPRSRPDCDPFAWEHLLAVCPGGTNVGSSDAHCDKRRGNRPLALHPGRRAPDTETVLTFYKDGVVKSDDHPDDLEVLGLAVGILNRQRKQAIATILEKIGAANRNPKPADRVRALRALLVPYERPDGHLPPFPLAVLPLVRKAVHQAEGTAARIRAER